MEKEVKYITENRSPSVMERKMPSESKTTSEKKKPLSEMGNTIQSEGESFEKMKIMSELKKKTNFISERKMCEMSKEDGNYFRSLLKVQREKLENLIAQANRELERGLELPEEAGGKFRVASGRARLIMERKFKQFEELCRKNLERPPEEVFAVTNGDLAGYWDAVMIQVDQIVNIFEQGFDIIKH